MNYDYILKWCFGILFILLTLLRLFSRIRFEKRGPFSMHHLADGKLLMVIRWILGIPLGFSMMEYFFFQHSVPWMYLPLPVFIRGIGVFLGYSSVCFLAVVHYYLGKNFNSGSSVKQNHSLITGGPYRYVRHPMYVGFFLLFFSSFLISENWLIGLSGMMTILTLMTLRLKLEEENLEQYFGNDYLAYRMKTGAFLPKCSLFSKSRK